ncbi:MAG TPA: response regulator [Flavipsychrobacter sp.]|nr:response regulator [Flavipsychrobacter sp.]
MTTPQRKILIVDDDPVMSKVIEKFLTKDGHICHPAKSAGEAFSMLQNFKPDIILSDYEMPGINGFEFRQQLLQHDSWKDIPFIFLTSHSEEGLVMGGLNLSAIDFIIKGTPYPVIASKIENLLNSLQYEHERSIEELKKAAERLPISSIPVAEPQIEGYAIRFWNKSYQNYPGGDFMDYIRADDRYTFILMGDIMGKKWEAWFFSFGYLSYIRSAIRFCILDRNLSCLEIVKKINKVVCLDDSLKDILSSLTLIRLDHYSGEITYTGAGDFPILHYSAENQSTVVVGSGGLLLGLQNDGYFDEQVIRLQDGDKLLAFTDGVTDMFVNGHEQSSFLLVKDKLAETLKDDKAYETISGNLSENLSGGQQVDDASLIYIEKIIRNDH